MADSRLFRALLALWILFFSNVFAAPQPEDAEPLESRQVPASVISPYAPTSVACPSTPLIRAGRNISPEEKTYAAKRYAKASKALKGYLKTQGSFPTLSKYPMLSLANGGGGIRGFLTSAGNHIAFDAREGSKYTTSGLLQAITYETGLSGSAIMLSSYAGQNYPKTTTLFKTLWQPAFANGLFEPDGAAGSGQAYAGISKDVLAKQAAGGPVSFTDVLGRLFGYVAFSNEPNGVAGLTKTMSGVLAQPAYKKFEAPIPILGSLGVEENSEACGLVPQNATQWEFNPFEFGSFDPKIKAFQPMEFMGTALDNGKPASRLLAPQCTKNFDRLSFVTASSTAVFNEFCGKLVFDQVDNLLTEADLGILRNVLDPITGTSQTPLFTLIPNFAHNFPGSPKVNFQKNLKLVDGGENIQVIPVWPILFRKEVDVMFLTDSSTYGLGSMQIDFPNGRSLHNSYLQAIANGVGNRFPVIPPPSVFLKKGFTERPVFFGCNSSPTSPAMTIIYAPNADYTFPSNVSTQQNKFKPADSQGILLNGVQVATAGNAKDYGFCVSCAIMKRRTEAEGKALPSGCSACIKKYCYN